MVELLSLLVATQESRIYRNPVHALRNATMRLIKAKKSLKVPAEAEIEFSEYQSDLHRLSWLPHPHKLEWPLFREASDNNFS